LIVVLYDDLAFSFSKVARLTIKGLNKIGYRLVSLNSVHTTYMIPRSGRVIVIGDTAWFGVSREHIKFIKQTEKLLLWTDTPVEPLWIAQYADSYCNTCHIVCHPYWYREYAKAGIPVHGWIPRQVDEDIVKQVLEKDREELCRDLWSKYGRYILTVGSDHTTGFSKPPRKGLDAYDAMCGEIKRRHDVNCLYVGSWSMRNAVKVSYHGGLSEYELLRLMRCAEVFVWASRSEGFGMPPVEAMSVGTIVVASAAPFNDHIYGIKFDIEDVEVSWCQAVMMPYRIFDYRLSELIDTVDYALSLPEDDKERIRELAIEHARKVFRTDIIAYALIEV